jgi:hypothetical protein
MPTNDNGLPPPLTPSSPSSPPAVVITPKSPGISFRPDPITGEQSLAIAPGTTIKAYGPPPSPWAQLIVLVPDLTAILVFAAFEHWWGPQITITAIMGVLYLRVKGASPGEAITSGFATAADALIRGARRVFRKKESP